MIIKGKVHKFGNNINTDDIIAAKYLVSTDEKELGKHCMENIAPDFMRKLNKGDIIVAGRNFGCGSSREHATWALKGSGITAVIARSFAGIFFRNAINVGLPFLQMDEADKIKDGDLLEIDLASGIINNLSSDQTYKTEPFPEFLQNIVKQGGLMNYIKKHSSRDCPMLASKASRVGKGQSPSGTVPCKEWTDPRQGKLSLRDVRLSLPSEIS